jgi:hypothetical protein
MVFFFRAYFFVFVRPSFFYSFMIGCSLRVCARCLVPRSMFNRTPSRRNRCSWVTLIISMCRGRSSIHRVSWIIRSRYDVRVLADRCCSRCWLWWHDRLLETMNELHFTSRVYFITYCIHNRSIICSALRPSFCHLHCSRVTGTQYD